MASTLADVEHAVGLGCARLSTTSDATDNGLTFRFPCLRVCTVSMFRAVMRCVLQAVHELKYPKVRAAAVAVLSSIVARSPCTLPAPPDGHRLISRHECASVPR